MNEALARRVFLAVVVTCLFTFGLTSAIAVQGLGDVGTESAGRPDAVSAAAQQQGHTLAAIVPNASEQQQLAVVDGNIASASADLAQATADSGVPQDK